MLAFGIKAGRLKPQQGWGHMAVLGSPLSVMVLPLDRRLFEVLAAVLE